MTAVNCIATYNKKIKDITKAQFKTWKQFYGKLVFINYDQMCHTIVTKQ